MVQLFAYALVARNNAAWATSSGVPRRFCGMASKAKDLASGVIAMLYIRFLVSVNESLASWISTSGHVCLNVARNNCIHSDVLRP